MTTNATTDPAETIPFGPVLLGQTEKTLQALLQRALAGTGLNEPQWVALRLANMLDGQVDHAGLIAAVADRTKFSDATEIVASVLAASETANGSLWRDLPVDDVEAATRVLNEVLRRARQLAA